MREFCPPEYYYKLFKGDEIGEAVLADLLRHFYHIEAYAKGDSHETAYLNGHRFVMGYIQNKITAGSGTDADYAASSTFKENDND